MAPEPITEADRAGLNFFFASIPLSELPPLEGGLATVSGDTPLLKVVELLRDRGLLAVPVEDPSKPAEAPWVERYLGIVDMVGISFYLLKNTSGSHRMDQLHDHQKISGVQVSALVGGARWTPFVPLEPKHTLYDAMLVMGKYSIHRVPVVDGDKIVNVLTQSTVISAVAKHMDQFKAIGKRTLQQLGMAEPNQVWCVKLDNTVRDAMKLIEEHHINAVPVIGVNGAVVGNLSARDLRSVIIEPEFFKLINKPVSVFLSEVSAFDHEEMSPAITCRSHDTLEHVVQKLAATRIHRIYLCDTQNKPIRVVSLSDILQVFVTPSEGYFEDPRFAQVAHRQ